MEEKMNKEQFKKMLYSKIAQRAKQTGKSLAETSRELREALERKMNK
jgi:hypothetical protein